MNSAPSVPGVEVGASWLGGCGQVLTAVAPELPAALRRMLGSAAVDMTDAALQAVEPPSGAAIGLAPSYPAGGSGIAPGRPP
jgi:hypothetical protein